MQYGKSVIVGIKNRGRILGFRVANQVKQRG
jgi:pyrimidine operon attenuation protein/uracil phosphoribosyltransferase